MWLINMVADDRELDAPLLWLLCRPVAASQGAGSFCLPLTGSRHKQDPSPPRLSPGVISVPDDHSETIHESVLSGAPA